MPKNFGPAPPVKEQYPGPLVPPPQKKKKEMDLEMREWFLKEYPGPQGCKVRIHPLWGNYYRINYWVTIDKEDCFNKDNSIADSMFVKIIKTGDSYDLVRY
jgi:hypothetical protein